MLKQLEKKTSASTDYNIIISLLIIIRNKKINIFFVLTKTQKL